MKNLIKNICVTIVLMFVTTTNYAYDGYYYNTSQPCQPDNNCNSCEPSCCGGWLISADLLYWRAFERGLDFCVITDSTDSTNAEGVISSRFRGESFEPHYKWSPGFRIGVAFEPVCGNWDMGLYWTDFHSHAETSEDLLDEFKWNINFDILDFIVGYDADLGSCFIFRPFFGLRGARINQKIHINEFPDLTVPVDEAITFSTKQKQCFAAAGPIFGLEGDWNIGCGFSFYTTASISFLYGNVHVNLSEFEESSDSTNCCSVEKHFNTTLTAADAGLGIRWRQCFCGNKELILQFGLETHRFFDYNYIGYCGDLSFDGFNFSAGIEF